MSHSIQTRWQSINQDFEYWIKWFPVLYLHSIQVYYTIADTQLHRGQGRALMRLSSFFGSMRVICIKHNLLAHRSLACKKTSKMVLFTPWKSIFITTMSRSIKNVVCKSIDCVMPTIIPLFSRIPFHILASTSSPSFQLIFFLEPEPMYLPTPPPSCRDETNSSCKHYYPLCFFCCFFFIFGDIKLHVQLRSHDNCSAISGISRCHSPAGTRVEPQTFHNDGQAGYFYLVYHVL